MQSQRPDTFIIVILNVLNKTILVSQTLAHHQGNVNKLHAFFLHRSARQQCVAHFLYRNPRYKDRTVFLIQQMVKTTVPLVVVVHHLSKL